MSRKSVATKSSSKEANMKAICDDVLAKRKTLLTRLKVEEETNAKLREQLASKERDCTHLRRALIESVDGITFNSFDKNGRAHVHVKKDIGEAKKYDIQVTYLTAILKKLGRLDEIIDDLKEMEDPPADSFLTPGFNIGGPSVTAKDNAHSLILQLQRGTDAGQLER